MFWRCITGKFTDKGKIDICNIVLPILYKLMEQNRSTIELWITSIKYFFPDCNNLDNFVVGFRTSGNLTSREFTKEVIFYTHSGSPVGCGETLKVTCHKCVTAYARSIFVWIPGRQRVLTICEFEVYTEGEYHSSIPLKGNIRFDVGVLCSQVLVIMSELVLLMSWCWLGNKSIPSLVMAHLHIHIGIIRTQCIGGVLWDCISIRASFYEWIHVSPTCFI